MSVFFFGTSISSLFLTFSPFSAEVLLRGSGKKKGLFSGRTRTFEAIFPAPLPFLRRVEKTGSGGPPPSSREAGLHLPNRGEKTTPWSLGPLMG